MADDGESLESWLNKATNPSNRHEDWEYIMGFCDQVNKELEGPQIAVRLLAHKIQSPQEWEALQALTLLEACMKNCGRRFHSEVGKFRFLNELIKVVSPKYLGDKIPEKVKRKVIEMLYSWTVSLPEEAKICEAYQMLKTQGIVLEDPKVAPDVTLAPPPSGRPKNPVFEDEEKSRRLAVLLKSKKPEDLQEANRLIKNMVKEDDVRTKKVTKLKNTLEAVNNSVKLLNEMLAYFSPEDSADADKDLIRELYGDCDKLRQTVFQLATETEDNDASLGDILQASDDLSSAINSYKKIVEGQTINGETKEAQSSVKQGPSCKSQSEILIDLMDLNIQTQSPSSQEPSGCPLSIPADLLCGSPATDPQLVASSQPSEALFLLNEDLLSLGLSETVSGKSAIPTHGNHSNNLQLLQDSNLDLDLLDATPSPAPTFSAPMFTQHTFPVAKAPRSPDKSQTTLPASGFPLPSLLTDAIAVTSDPQPHEGCILTSPAPVSVPQSHNMAFCTPAVPCDTPQQSLTAAEPSQAASGSLNNNLQDLALLDLGSPKDFPVKSEDGSIPAGLSSSIGGTSLTSGPLLLGEMLSPPVKCPAESPLLPPFHPAAGEEISLTNVFVPLDAIKPSKVCPVTAYDKSGVRVLLHFATDCPPGRPDVLVMVASMLNTAPLPVRNIVLQAAVPKTMKVKLQSPSGTELAPFNPVLPPAAITQVMLLANPLKENVRMRYKLTFTLGEQPYTEVGEVNDFPPAASWGAL